MIKIVQFMKKINVSECFYSIQGEGQTMGVPAVFLRLSKCNLLCQGKGWVCDSIEVWRKGVRTEFDDVLTDEYIEHLKRGAHLVITGGEPLLHQQAIEDYLEWFKKAWDFIPTLEIETNGTIMPAEYLLNVVDYWNCSPKLSSSGETLMRRYKPLVLDKLSSYNTIFKFVISSETDFLEITEDFVEHIDTDKLILMPAGDTQEKLNITRPMVMELCKDYTIKYCDRLHVVAWNLKTGV
jgi:7-carboxy-7-deazaguanine synthase